MSVKKTKMVVIILALAGFVCGVILVVLMGQNLALDLRTNILFGALLSAPVFILLKILEKTLRVIEIRNVVKPYVITGYATWIAVILFYAKVSIWGVRNLEQVIPGFAIIVVFSFSLSSVHVLLFVLGATDIQKKKASIANYVVYCRKPKKQNTDNSVVTLARLQTPEMYFESKECSDVYYAHEAYICELSEEMAAHFILENNLQEDIYGEYFASRVDFFYNDGFSPSLSYMMTFISREIIDHLMYGFRLRREVKEKEYCVITCHFNYHRSHTDNPFEYSDVEIEFK